jgi:hypothetical protein
MSRADPHEAPTEEECMTPEATQDPKTTPEERVREIVREELARWDAETLERLQRRVAEELDVVLPEDGAPCPR